MEYLKANEILPDELLKALQRYAGGCLVYVPAELGIRRGWGSMTGTRAYIQSRNNDIVEDRRAGLSVREITAKYNLAESTVRNILYKK